MSKVEAFYDDFSHGFVEDIVQDNERVAQQLDFFARAIPSNVESVLVIGCGSGQGAHFIASSVAKNAKLLAVDISGENLRLAHKLFPNERIEYRKLDITSDSVEGVWDVIVLPDVYEHIPKSARQHLHARFNRLLSRQSRILFTVPSPGKQASLYETGKGLQIVDEVVTLEDLSKAAADVGAVLTYFNMVSVWETNDYIHAVVERDAAQVKPIRAADMLSIKGWPRQSLVVRGWKSMGHRLHLFRFLQSWKRRRIQKRLADGTSPD